MAKNREWDKWDKLDKMPEGWKKADDVLFNPPKGYIFITNGKAPLKGRKTAMLKIDDSSSSQKTQKPMAKLTKKQLTAKINRINNEAKKIMLESGAKVKTVTNNTFVGGSKTYKEALKETGKRETKGIIDAKFSVKSKVQVPNSPKIKK